MSFKTSKTKEGITITVMDRLNEIKGGSRNGQDAWVFYDPWGGSIVEMNSAIANGFDHSACFSSIDVKGLWNKTETFDWIEKQIGGKLCEDAKRALLNANIRGVQVAIYFHKKDFENEMFNAWEFYNKHKFEVDQVQRIERLPQKEWEKVRNIIKKYGNL